MWRSRYRVSTLAGLGFRTPETLYGKRPISSAMFLVIGAVVVVVAAVLGMSYWRASGLNQSGGFSKIETTPPGGRR